jgi:Tfp pilus assembly protein PilN
MPNINLIAARREEKRRLLRTTRQLFFGLVGAGGCLATTLVYLGTARVQALVHHAEAEKKMKAIQPKLDRIAEIEKLQQTLRPKVETLHTAKMNTLRWRAVFSAVSQSLAPNTYLNGLSATASETDTTLRLAGTTASQTLVGDTMSKLNTQPLFDKVDLTFTQSQPNTDQVRQNVTFEIGVHLRSLTPPKPVTKEGDGTDASKTAQVNTDINRSNTGAKGNGNG